MKKIKLGWLVFPLLMLVGCLEDTGNYEYMDIKSPVWLFDVEKNNIDVYCRQGGIAVFKASDRFTWEKDSAQRASEVRYEWRLNDMDDILISEELDFEIPTNELIKKINLTALKGKGMMGTFRIIEKGTEITFMARFYLTINPYYSHWDWVALSEEGNDTKCTIIFRRKQDGKLIFEAEENSFKKVNGTNIPGKPVDLAISKALNISPLGATTVITDKVAYEVSSATCEKTGEIKNQFLDGTPPDFLASDRRDIDSDGMGKGNYTFVATVDGKVYTRTMTENFLGGSFLTEPYYLDEKGYFITRFGHTSYSHPNIPCYDEKNRRIVMANVWRVDVNDGPDLSTQVSVFKSRLVAPNAKNVSFCVPAWNMPEGTEMLHITQASHLMDARGTSSGYTLFFNKNNVTYMWDFVISNQYMNYMDSYDAYLRSTQNPFPVTFTKETQILTSCNPYPRSCDAVYRILYSQGSEVRYLQRSKTYMDATLTDNPLITTDSKVTSITYDWYDCLTLVVGCENGDIYFYDINNINRPILINKVNVGGRVFGMRQYGSHSSTKDYY